MTLRYLIAAILFFIPLNSMALVKVFDGNSIDITLSYTEPSTNANSTPLVDLRRCYGVIDLIGDGQSSQPWSVLASSPTGGQAQSLSLTFPLTPEQATLVTEITGEAQCEDLAEPPNIGTIATLATPVTFELPPVVDTVPPSPPVLQVIITIVVKP